MAPERDSLLGELFNPRVIYGTGIGQSQQAPSLQAALSVGYRAIDTGGTAAYDPEFVGRELKSEIAYGDGRNVPFEATRSSIIIQGKYSPPYSWFWHSEEASPYNFEDPVALQVLKSISSDLSSLGVEYFDVYFLHRPFPSSENTFAAWDAMEEIVRQGGARYLGISQVTIDQLQQLWDKANIKPIVVQNAFFAHEGFDADVRRFCRDHNIVYQAFKVFDEQNLKWIEGLLGANPGLRKPGFSSVYMMVNAIMRAANENGEMFCIVDGSRDIEHMKANLLAARNNGEGFLEKEWLSELRLE